MKSVRNYTAQTVKGGLGTGGTLGVQGGSTPASKELDKSSTTTKAPAKKAATPATTTKKPTTGQ